MAIADAPTKFRILGPIGFEGKVDRDRRRIEGFSVVTRGEAIGHGVWLDRRFLNQVREVGAANGPIKAHYSHPGLSGDGLASSLGRVTNFRRREDRVYADLHFFEAAAKSPKGNLVDHVMTLAEEAPEDFGASIVFDRDEAAETKFSKENKNDDGEFSSPDDDNSKQLLHARLAVLHAVDMVGDPAANAGGLFAIPGGTEIPAAAEALVEYAFGLSPEFPEMALTLGVHPDRAKIFLGKFLSSRGLTITDQPPIANELRAINAKLNRILARQITLKTGGLLR